MSGGGPLSELVVRATSPRPRGPGEQHRTLGAPGQPLTRNDLDAWWPDVPDAVAGALLEGPVPLTALEEAAGPQVTRLHALLTWLWRERALALSDDVDDPGLIVVPTVHDVGLSFALPPGKWRLSRFAYLRLAESGELQIESPRHALRVTVTRPIVTAVVTALAEPLDASELAKELGGEASEPLARTFLTLLRAGGVIEPVDADGNRAEDLDSTLAQWEFHDLLFHARSRMGRHSEPMGGLFRFRDVLPPQPVVKENPWAHRAIALVRPSFPSVAARDPSLSEAIESRFSDRDQDFAHPIALAQIGEFLFRTARNRRHIHTEMGDFTSRPYPGGGAGYELELYLTVNACRDLDRGIYYYDPEHHTLCKVRDPDEGMEALLDDAWLSSARLCRPQVLVSIAGRFQRMSWKYSGIAYATELKNVGAAYQTFYLVASAMGLAGCALGLGNADLLSRLVGTDYFAESSIGEFMLGSSQNRRR